MRMARSSLHFDKAKEYTSSNTAEIYSLDGIIADADSLGLGADSKGNPKAFTFTFQDLFTEQYRELPHEIGLSLGLAVLAVTLIIPSL